jgi:hypothetical protein
MGDGFFELLVMDACQAILVKLVYQIHLRLVLAVITAARSDPRHPSPCAWTTCPHGDGRVADDGPHARMTMDALPTIGVENVGEFMMAGQIGLL